MNLVNVELALTTGNKLSAMYRAFEIPEIVRLMADQALSYRYQLLGEYPPFSVDTADMRSCACMARTCRTFYEPVMDALWTCMPSLEPLGRSAEQVDARRSSIVEASDSARYTGG